MSFRVIQQFCRQLSVVHSLRGASTVVSQVAAPPSQATFWFSFYFRVQVKVRNAAQIVFQVVNQIQMSFRVIYQFYGILSVVRRLRGASTVVTQVAAPPSQATFRFSFYFRVQVKVRHAVQIVYQVVNQIQMSFRVVQQFYGILSVVHILRGASTVLTKVAAPPSQATFWFSFHLRVQLQVRHTAQIVYQVVNQIQMSYRVIQQFYGILSVVHRLRGASTVVTKVAAPPSQAAFRFSFYFRV